MVDLTFVPVIDRPFGELKRISLDETPDIARDTGTPAVGDYVNKIPFTFTGTLGKVMIEFSENGLQAGDIKQLEEASKEVAAVRE